MSAAHGDLDRLLERLIEKTPGARHALVLSRDGLTLCRTAGLSVEQTDQLAAIASGIQSLSRGASAEFGDGTGGARQATTEFHGGLLCIVEAGEGAHVALVASDDADVGVIGHRMAHLVERIGAYLNTPPGTGTDAGGTT